MKVSPVSRRFTSGKAAFHLNAIQLAARDTVLERLESGEYLLVTKDCPLCCSDDGAVVATKEMYGLPCEVAVCKSCSFVFSRKQLSENSLNKFYTDEYRRLDRGREFPGSEFYDLQYDKGSILDAFMRDQSVTLPRHSLILEIGCGAGGILGYFKDRGHEVIGFDLGSEYLEYGRKSHNLNLHNGNLETAISLLNAEGKNPKLIIYEQVLEHISDPVSELKRLRELIAPDAFLFVGVPGLRNIDEHYNSNFLRYLQIPHLVHFELRSLVQAAELAGFSLISGNEVVRALFRPAQVNRMSKKPECAVSRGEPEMVVYLRAMERRWEAKNYRPAIDRIREFVARCAKRAFRVLRRLSRVV